MTKRHKALAPLDSDLPPETRALAEGLRELRMWLDPESPVPLGTVAEMLFRHAKYTLSASAVSRYLGGKTAVPSNFVEHLHALAERASGGKDGFKPLSHYLELHRKAESADSRSPKELRARIRTLEGECEQARSECAQARSVIASLQLNFSRLLTALPAQREAGSHADRASIWAASGLAGHLPVPPDAGDRQRSAADVAAARQLVQRASELLVEDAHSAITLLQGTTEVLTPLEGAASLVLLRQGHHELAEAFIQMYGRTRSDRAIMSAAVQLHEYGMPDDASAMLRAAIGQSAGEHHA
ncbi:hypothetical protein [Streptomyces abikoensis]